ncbi:MAG: asparaginase [Alphaproteobacteria bacterium]|nr:asparaginase [Alphaproteobacteria bacterium]
MTDRPITVFTLGGTIAMAPGAAGGGAVPALGAEALMAAVPGLARVAAVTAVDFRTLPGAHLSVDDILELARAIEAARAKGAAGAVVVQGTDTIEETAFVLDAVLDPAFPVAVTGAMRHPAQPGADGPANLLAAAALAADPGAAGIGTVVVMSDEIHAAQWVQKTHATRPGAFASPGAGPIGFISEGAARILAKPVARAHVALAAIGPEAARVALVTVGLGDDGTLLGRAAEGDFAGLVVAAMGAGHVPEPVAEAIGAAARRMPAVVCSRTGAGAELAATYGFAGSETDLVARGAIRAGWLAPVKARLLLTLGLRAGYDEPAIRAAFAACGGG